MDGYQYEEDAGSSVMSELITDEEWYETHGGFVLTLMGQDEPWDGHSIKDTVAKKALKAFNGGNAEYREVFGECSVDGCESGCNGFDEDYCYDHEDRSSNDDSDSDDNDTSDEVSLDDLSEDDKQKLVQEVMDQL